MLIIVFVLPGIAAYIVYKNPSLLNAKSTNHGQFVKPPVLFSELPKSNKWHLVYYSAGNCREKCMGDLDKLARIRLALGRRLYDVDSYLLLSRLAKNLTAEQERILQDVNIFVLKFAADKQQYKHVFINDAAYFIINPEGYIILSFAADSPSDDIFQDLKKLVND